MSYKIPEDTLNSIFFRTIDPESPIPNCAAMTTILYKVCDQNHDKFDESLRIIQLFMEEAYEKGIESTLPDDVEVCETVDGTKYAIATKPDQVVVQFDDTLNDLGWEMNNWLGDNGMTTNAQVFNGIKGFLRDIIQTWVDKNVNKNA